MPQPPSKASRRPNLRRVSREILLSLWKIHILHHAGEAGVVGNWMLVELRRHGYSVSPGTLYPMLARMEHRLGWLRSDRPSGRSRQRRRYHLMPEGRSVLALVRRQLAELHGELH